jgi:hypothetical protein
VQQEAAPQSAAAATGEARGARGRPSGGARQETRQTGNAEGRGGGRQGTRGRRERDERARRGRRATYPQQFTVFIYMMF